MSLRRWLASFALLSLSCLSASRGAEVLGSFPFEYHRGYLWIDVRAQGSATPLHFLLDSGAASSLLDRAAAQRLGVALGKGERINGVTANATANQVHGWVAHVAQVPLPSDLLAMDLRSLGIACDRPIDGLLGADFFQGRIVQIDYPARRVRVLAAAQATAGAQVLPLKASHRCWLAPVQIAGRAQQWMRVDTGCDSALEWVVSGKAANLGAGAATVGLANASTANALLAIQLGKLPLQAATGLHQQRFFSKEDGLMGNGLLSRFVVTLDIPHGRMVIEAGAMASGAASTKATQEP